MKSKKHINIVIIVFTIISILNSFGITKEFKKLENKSSDVKSEDMELEITPIEVDMVRLPSETISENVTSKIKNEVTLETETETELEMETETETVTETNTMTETETETVTENQVLSEEEPDDLEEYIYYLINMYSSNETNRIELNYDNIYLLAQLTYAEAHVEPFEGKVAVCEVCINRIFSYEMKYSDLKDVIFDDNQFSTVMNGTIYNVPTKEEALAAVEAIMGASPTNGALYFDDPSLVTSWASNNRKKDVKIGGHQFYY